MLLLTTIIDDLITYSTWCRQCGDDHTPASGLRSRPLCDGFNDLILFGRHTKDQLI
jgi:hypothetical protein